MSNMNKLETLKKTLHPEKQMNIIDQCMIVAEALSETGEYYGNAEGLAIYLEISDSKLYQMHRVWRDMTPELKEWFRGTEFQCRTAYDWAVKPRKEQLEFLKGMDIFTNRRDTSKQKIIGEKDDDFKR